MRPNRKQEKDISLALTHNTQSGGIHVGLWEAYGAGADGRGRKGALETGGILRPPPAAFLTAEGTFQQGCVTGVEVKGGQCSRRADFTFR